MTRARRRTRTLPASPPPPPAPVLYEVIREHEASGRVQLVEWGLDAERAKFVTDGMNAIAGNAGEALASSGKIERGWVFRMRKPGGRR